MAAETSTIDRRGDEVSLPAATPQGTAPRRPRTSRLVALVAVLALLGGALGLTLALTNPPEPSATVRFVVLPDPDLPGDSQGSDDQDRFVQTQLLVLGGGDMRAKVADALDVPRAPDVDAVQVGGTDVVEVTVSGATSRAATRGAGEVLRIYNDQRDAAFAAKANALDGALAQQLKTVQSALQRPDASGSSGLESSAATEYARLLATSNDLGLVSAADRAFTSLVQTPTPVVHSTGALEARDAVLGLLAGLLVGLAVVLGPRWVRSV